MNQKEKVCYNTDASRLIGKAEKVVLPKNIEEVKQIVKSANLDIVPRGAGTGFVGGAIPHDSIVVDMSKMTLVSNFNPLRRSVHVEAGTTIKELNEKLKPIGYEFPIFPANSGISSIGGMIATNASGNRSMKYGHMKDWIEEIEFVNAKTEFIKTSKTDISEVCGLEGTTGIITGATLKIIPIIKRSISIFQSNNLDEILSVARQLKQEKETSMLAFFSKQVSKILGFPESYHIIIEFDSERGKITGQKYEELSRIKEKAYRILFSEGYYNSEDPKMFFDKIKEFVIFLEMNNIPYFGDLGEGLILPFFKDNEKAKRNEIFELIKKMRLKTGKYGYGLTRKSLLDSFEARLVQRIKSRHDPGEKFNKNKLIETGSIPIIEKEIKRTEKIPRTIEKQEVRNKIFTPFKKQENELKFFEEAKKELMLEGIKTPEEKLNEFIKKVEIIDRTPEKNIPEEISKIEEQKIKEEIKEQLLDYEQTFESELSEEKRKKIEDFAKNIPRETIERQSFNPKKSTTVDFKMINKIMTNNRANSQANSDIGKISITDNLDRKPEKIESSKGIRFGEMKKISEDKKPEEKPDSNNN